MNMFSQLSSKEKETLYNAPSLVMILIAGADGNIDDKEVSRAMSITKQNASSEKGYLHEFYKEVADNFHDKFHHLLYSLPSDQVKRNEIITQRLSRLNKIFQKTNKTFNIVLYFSLRRLAVEIAKSSGGVMGINSICQEELEFLELPMIKDPSLLFS